MLPRAKGSMPRAKLLRAALLLLTPHAGAFSPPLRFRTPSGPLTVAAANVGALQCSTPAAATLGQHAGRCRRRHDTPPTMLYAIGRPRGIVALVAVIAAAATALMRRGRPAPAAAATPSPPAAASDDGLEESLAILDSVQVRCCDLQLERRPELALERLCILAKPSTVEVEQLKELFAGLRRVCDRGDRFTVYWDLRKLRPPSRAALDYGVEWMAQPENAEDLDRFIEAIVILVSSPIVRLVANWCVRACNPPNPVHVVTSEDEVIGLAQGYR